MSSNGGGGSNLLDMGLMIAAGVAAPELAPVLFEGGLAGSTALATAATGAALSGAAGAITGQNVARSAGIGALGGALSGALAPASGGIDSLGAVSDVAPVTEGAPIASETGDIATNTSGEMLTPQGAVINPQATPATMGNTQDIADMEAGSSAGRVPTATGANANTYMPNAPSSTAGAAGKNFLGMGPATNLQMGVSGLTNVYGYQTPRPGAYTPPPYKGGSLSKFKYDPNNYQPDVVTPPNPVYHAQYAQGGITSLATGGNPGQFDTPLQNPTGYKLQPNMMYTQVLQDPNSLLPQDILNIMQANGFAGGNGGFDFPNFGGPTSSSAQGHAAGGMMTGGTGKDALKDLLSSRDAMDQYESQYQSDPTAVAGKAQGGDYNAMLVLNKLRGTPNANYAGGGIANLGGYSDGGRLLKGPGDGMSDSIPAKIGKKQEARLAEGEFVVPADVVSGLGNGSTDAGAKHLYKMMDKVRHARTGRKSQGKQITAEKYIPA
jgi:hypothetical protein